jgi:hypothetical protein
MHADLLHPSRFLKSAEFKGNDVTFTIAEVALEELERDDNSKETKGVVAFKETPKLLLLNRTNSTCLKEMFGVETEQWKGKRVTFFPEPMIDPFTKKPISAIRVKGSPDLKAPVGVSIKLRKRKAQTRTMLVTGNAAAGFDVDHVEAEKDAIRSAMVATSLGEMDAEWSRSIGPRIQQLPLAGDRDEMKKFFSATKGAKARAAKAGAPAEVVKFDKPAEEAPPPSYEQF